MKLSYQYLTTCVTPHTLLLLKRHMRWVRAAGCIVEDAGGNLLLILRNNRWDLPKGKVEAAETLRQAALRETEEETGIDALSLALATTPFVKTYHIFNLYGGWHLKQTTWFCAHTPLLQPPTAPQTAEGIAQCRWVPKAQAAQLLMHSYGTLKTIARQWTNCNK